MVSDLIESCCSLGTGQVLERTGREMFVIISPTAAVWHWPVSFLNIITVLFRIFTTQWRLLEINIHISVLLL
jgi:hypothetical protein